MDCDPGIAKTLRHLRDFLIRLGGQNIRRVLFVARLERIVRCGHLVRSEVMRADHHYGARCLYG
ncbi:hypothetical protein D3C76_1644250 [compost metagenome]